MSVGFVLTHDRGKWDIFAHNPEPWGGFMSDILQYYLFPYFTVGDTVIDPYDGAEYSGNTLLSLIDKLEEGIKYIERKDDDWPLTPEQTEKYHESGRIYKIVLLPPKQQSIEILKRAIYLASIAHQQNERLLFIGD
jgi:hypothetical protein